MSKFSPCMLNLSGKNSVVFGGGIVAARKVRQLLDAGCSVKVISPVFSEKILPLLNVVDYEERGFQAGDTKDAFIVVAATNSASVNQSIYDDAIGNEIPFINMANDQKQSNFYFPSSIQRGPLHIAVSTSGTSPIVAKRITDQLAEDYGPEYEDYLKTIGSEREAIIGRIEDPTVKKLLLQFLSHEIWLEAVKNKDTSKIFQLKRQLLQKEEELG